METKYKKKITLKVEILGLEMPLMIYLKITCLIENQTYSHLVFYVLFIFSTIYCCT